jgi:hypothetical protein
MKILMAIIAASLIPSTARGYVFSYQDSISLSTHMYSEEEDILPSLNSPAGMFNGPLATLVSDVSVIGNTVICNNGEVQCYGSQDFPPPLGVVMESSYNVAALSSGSIVSPGSDWGTGGDIGGYAVGDEITPVGDPAFLNPNGSYVGIEFPDVNDQIHYGWLLVRYDQPQGTYFGTIELLQAAYETDPGVPITIVPEPALVGLTLIAIPIFGVRRRK